MPAVRVITRDSKGEPTAVWDLPHPLPTRKDGSWTAEVQGVMGLIVEAHASGGSGEVQYREYDPQRSYWQQCPRYWDSEYRRRWADSAAGIQASDAWSRARRARYTDTDEEEE